jgi:hypothetical protein
MGLEYLNLASRNDGAPDAANELLALAAEHHPADYLDPSTASTEVEV